MTFKDACEAAGEMAADFQTKVVVLHAPRECDDADGPFTCWPEYAARILCPTGRILTYRDRPFVPKVEITARSRSRVSTPAAV